MGKGLHAAALDEARKALTALQADRNAFQAEREALRSAAAKLPAGSSLHLTEGDKRLQEIEAWQGKLQAAIANLEDVIRQANDVKRKEAQALVAEARVLEDQAEYGQAIARYEKALKLVNGEQPEIAKHLAALQKAWKTKGEKHEQARQFIYETWPKLPTSRQIQEQLRTAEAALRTCRAAGDRLSVEKLLLSSLSHTTVLQIELDALKKQDDEDARDQIRTIEATAGDLEKLLKEARDFLKAGK